MHQFTIYTIIFPFLQHFGTLITLNGKPRQTISMVDAQALQDENIQPGVRHTARDRSVREKEFCLRIYDTQSDERFACKPDFEKAR